MQEVTDIEHCQPDEFEVKEIWREEFYNGRICQLIYNKNDMKTAYIYNKSSGEDDGYYAPYLVYEIGKQLGIKVPETEIRMVLHKDDRVATWGETFYESAIIYDEKLGNEISWIAGDKREFISQDDIYHSYLSQNSEKSQIGYNSILNKQTIDNHINANLQYFDENDREQIKQELIDRVLLSLRLGISGKFDIITRENGETILGPYFLASFNMFSLNEREEWIHNQLAKNDKEFTQTIQSKYMPQYSIKANEDKISAEELVKYIYDQYPEQAQKSYEKLSKFTVQDLEGVLNGCTRMGETHKKFALRFFEMRYQEFEQVHNSCQNRNKLKRLVETAGAVREQVEEAQQLEGNEQEQPNGHEETGIEEQQ